MKAIWDAFPVSEGHLLLTPHRHAATWAELHPTEQDALTRAIQRGRELLIERYAPDGFNIGFNEGAAGGQTVQHFHIHIIPRRSGDVADPRGGVRHVIPAKGNYLTSTMLGSAPEPVRLPANTPHTRALIEGGEDAAILGREFTKRKMPV